MNRILATSLFLALLMPALAASQNEKATADSFKGTLIGTVLFVDATQFLSDGTPFKALVLSVAPLQEDFLALCIGTKAVGDCGRLRIGRKATLTGFLAPIDAPCGASNGLSELYSFNVTKAVGR